MGELDWPFTFWPEDRVRHPEYGTGRVLMVGYSGLAPRVWVKFFQGDPTPRALSPTDDGLEIAHVGDHR